MRKLPSIRTVALRAGVSTATVSNVLNRRRSVAPDLVARVHAAVEELGYIADYGASRLRSRRSTVAGVLIPTISNPFFGTFVAVLEAAARRDGFDLLVVSSGDDVEQEKARLRALLTWRPAGVIVIACGAVDAGYEVAEAAGVKLVAVDRIPRGAAIDGIVVDNREVSAEVARHLTARGRRHILVAGSRLDVGNAAVRWEGAQEGAAGVARTEIVEVGFTLAENRAALAARLAHGPRPDALFTLNNIATLAALGVLQTAGMRIPQDVALVGFDDAEWMHVTTPPLTTVRQPIEAMGEAAWARLLARIGGDTSPPQQIRLACSLEIRASSAAARQPASVSVR